MKIHSLARSILLSAVATATLIGRAQAGTNDILFVGNSFTHGNNEPAYSFNNTNITDENGTSMGGIPGIFKQMTTQSGLTFNVSIEAVSSRTLAGHYSNASSIIGQAKWGTVVLQEQSTTPLPTSHGGNPTSFYTAASNLKNLVVSKNPSANMVLYETWASPTSVTDEGYSAGTTGLHQMTADLQSAYFKAYYDLGFTSVARVGDAFMSAVDSGYADANPSDGITAGMMNLWASDVRHPSKYGSYLSAAVFYAKITNLDPRLLSTTASNSAAFQLGISSADAPTLNSVAYQINALANPAPVAAPAVTKLSISKITISGSVNNATTPPTITGDATLTSITTAEGTFTNLVGATANNVTSSQNNNSLGTAPATKDAAASGLTLNDGVNNLSSGNFQLGGNFTASTRFFIVESAPVSSALGDDVTVTLVNSANQQVGSFTLSLTAGDFTPSAANNSSGALATLTYNAGVLAGQNSKLGGVSFSLADLGVTDIAAVALATGIRLSGGTSTLDPNVVGYFNAPEPASLSLFGVGGLMLLRRRRRQPMHDFPTAGTK